MNQSLSIRRARFRRQTNSNSFVVVETVQNRSAVPARYENSPHGYDLTSERDFLLDDRRNSVRRS